MTRVSPAPFADSPKGGFSTPRKPSPQKWDDKPKLLPLLSAHMTRLSCSLTALLFGLASTGAFAAEEPASPTPADNTPPPVPKIAPLTAEELAEAAKVDAVSIPTPGELLAAISKLGKPDWASAARPPIGTSYSSRAQMALNIGGLIADGFIAVEAKDAQQVKNIGRDIIALAKPLNVQQDILNRGKSLTDFAEHGQWDVLKEELEATQNEVKTAMLENKDTDLITLVTLGGWIRGIDAMAGYVNQHYTADGAKLLRQPAIAHFLSERLNALPEKLREDGTVKKVRIGLTVLEAAVSFPSGSVPSQDSVRELSSGTDDLLKEVAKKR